MSSEKFVVKFEKKATKKGKYFYFNIPIAFVRSKIIDPEIEYEIRVFKKESKIKNNSL